jgi:hypothetical protein
MAPTGTLYKVLNADGRSCHGGDLAWPLPTWTGHAWKPGKWLPRIDDIVACQRGYHVCEGRDLIQWLHERIWVIEAAPNAEWVRHGDDKWVTGGPVRLVAGTAWDDYTARLFAISCAHDVLPLYEAQHPGDTRVSDALVTAWEYAHGLATAEDLVAAMAAARAAASAAARAAASAAAWAAASAAAWAAASAAAWAAASAAARAAQSARLLRYLDGDVDV